MDMNITPPLSQNDINNVYDHVDEKAFEDLKKQFPTIPWTDNLFDDLWGKLSRNFTPKTKRYVRHCFFEHYSNRTTESRLRLQNST